MESLAVYLEDIVNRQKEYLSKEKEMQLTYPTGWTPKTIQENRDKLIELKMSAEEIGSEIKILQNLLIDQQIRRDKNVEHFDCVSTSGKKISFTLSKESDRFKKDGKETLKRRFNIPDSFWETITSKVSRGWRVSKVK
jgi:hypothetical protein